MVLEVEGEAAAVESFLARLPSEAPPLARVERVRADEASRAGERGFASWRASARASRDAPVTPDTATCDDCLAELFDPADRRFRYPFINCTNCGPRFTIVRGVPYDRPLTTMAGFEMCDRCRAEYEDPLDRRFHAQPNACPVCGPRLGAGRGAARRRAREHRGRRAALRGGAIVAVKGIGGFHLACRADDEARSRELRARKHREEKPFALMAPDVDAARALVELDDAEEALLESPRAADRAGAAAGRARAVAAARRARAARELGVMLPYTPLHHLLLGRRRRAAGDDERQRLRRADRLRDEDALERLAGIADASCCTTGRSRRAPTTRSCASCGGRRADAAALARLRARGDRAAGRGGAAAARLRRRAEEHLLPRPAASAPGSATTSATSRTTRRCASFRDGIAHFERLFAVDARGRRPRPASRTTSRPSTRSSARASSSSACSTTTRTSPRAWPSTARPGPAVGAIFDGTGYGTDGTVWGGELLVGDLAGFERAGTCSRCGCPAATAPSREPWRMACAWLRAALGIERRTLPAGAARRRSTRDAGAASARLAAAGSPRRSTTSMGRLFDAVAALCGVRTASATRARRRSSWRRVADAGRARRLPAAGRRRLRARRAADRRAVARRRRGGVAAGLIAARFHNGVARARRRRARAARAQRPRSRRALGRRVPEPPPARAHRRAARAAGLRVLIPDRLPPNDGGISYGQAAVAASG